jgi:hypothetical protein
MNAETQVEYFYGETLRWSFGFDNPNKAAVLFACAVPLLWWLWLAAWRIHPRWARLPALVVAAGLVAGAWYCLIMTFSRGGLVAALAALVYLTGTATWQGRQAAKSWFTSARVWMSVSLVLVLLGSTLGNGLGSRSAEALGNDASVGNRLELWQSALQMAHENPRGFGSGKSGAQYMQWYQPLERQQGYRTMVNSYLTFLVEQGWLWFVLVSLGFSLFWVWTQSANVLALACRASILGFLVAGAFSTTMEEWRLWMIPVISAVALAAMTLWQKSYRVAPKPLLLTNLAVVLALGALWLMGWQTSRHDPLRREFATTGNCRSVIAIGPRDYTAARLGCIIDEAVLGDRPAKLLRELAEGANVNVVLGESALTAPSILCMGRGVLQCTRLSAQTLWLVAPDMIKPAEIERLASVPKRIHLLLPEIDVDGRVAFWTEVGGGQLGTRVQLTSLVGVGNRVDWAWQQIIDLVKVGHRERAQRDACKVTGKDAE